eukprot:TRINITY_DN17959_c0_g1_i1.p1 TRINITY_DN17959_c0_g1~~TRINITY_DN17959_c0_g1_i1.p1  ORF type:complete len:506 (+),score=102.52 TRINITY_DN17959_c0_g1_i1:65-1582(+)
MAYPARQQPAKRPSGADSLQDDHLVAALIGNVGVGKTTLFNRVCDAHREAAITDDSCTRTFAKKRVFYDGKVMELYDGPGCNSKEDVFKHSYVLKEGLTFEPLNAIFVAVAYNPRIRNNMGGDFYEAAKVLKPAYYDLVVLLVTKMDQFVPEPPFHTRVEMEAHIRQVFRKDYDVDDVIFSDPRTSHKALFSEMYAAAARRPKLQLQYDDSEFLQFFDMKAWKGREQFDLRRLTKQVEKVCHEWEEGLAHLVRNKAQYTNEEFQDYVYAMIQQNQAQLNDDIYMVFTRRHGEDQVEFDDYAANIELQKVIYRAGREFRDLAKRHLAVNPDASGDWRNAIRRCQFCNEVWVKVEGCDDATNCGARPSTGDPDSSSFFRLVWEKIEGAWRPGKFLLESRKKRAKEQREGKVDRVIGCGKTIVWKDQAVVPQVELDVLFSTQDLENIINSFKLDRTFSRLKAKKQRKIRVWSELDADGRDIVCSPTREDSAEHEENEEDEESDGWHMT